MPAVLLSALWLVCQDQGALADSSLSAWKVETPAPPLEAHGQRAQEPSGTPRPPSRISRATGRARATQSGEASWYGPNFHGRPTASGEIFDQHSMTAAHKTLPLGSKARVTNLENGNSVEVTINDRGPFVAGRIIDLSRAAAAEIGIIESGVAPVKVELLGVG